MKIKWNYPKSKKDLLNSWKYMKHMSKRELHICNFAVAHRVDLTYKCKKPFLKKEKKVGKKKNKTILPSTSIGGSGCLIMGSSGSWEVVFPFMFDNSSSCEDSKQNQKLRTRKQKKTQNKIHNREIKSKIKQDKISIGDLYMQSFS